jgi:hypothetical protein
VTAITNDVGHFTSVVWENAHRTVVNLAQAFHPHLSTSVQHICRQRITNVMQIQFGGKGNGMRRAHSESGLN